MSLSFPADEFHPAPRRRRQRRRQGSSGSAAAAIAPLLLGTALAAVAIAGRSKVGAWLRGFLGPRPVPPAQDLLLRRVENGLPLTALRDSIVGRRKATVVSLYGPPRTAVAGDAPTALGNQRGFWRADTWYYPVDSVSQTAMAVRFQHGVAREVEFFDAPKTEV